MGGEGIVVDSVNDIIIRDGVSLEGSLPVNGLGSLVGVLGLATSGKDKPLEGNPGS
jgi:hypothetical protein